VHIGENKTGENNVGIRLRRTMLYSRTGQNNHTYFEFTLFHIARVSDLFQSNLNNFILPPPPVMHIKRYITIEIISPLMKVKRITRV